MNWSDMFSEIKTGAKKGTKDFFAPMRFGFNFFTLKYYYYSTKKDPNKFKLFKIYISLLSFIIITVISLVIYMSYMDTFHKNEIHVDTSNPLFIFSIIIFAGLLLSIGLTKEKLLKIINKTENDIEEDFQHNKEVIQELKMLNQSIPTPKNEKSEKKIRI